MFPLDSRRRCARYSTLTLAGDQGGLRLAARGRAGPVGPAPAGSLPGRRSDGARARKGNSPREIRQAHGMDADGAFCHTGVNCEPWCGHQEGNGFTVAGNMLVGPQVIQAMAEAFEAGRSGGRELSECLLLALEAGQAAGGDKRGKQWATLLVASSDPRGYHNLRVDDHADLVAELRRVYDHVVQHSLRIEREYGPEGLRLFSRVKY